MTLSIGFRRNGPHQLEATGCRRHTDRQAGRRLVGGGLSWPERSINTLSAIMCNPGPNTCRS